MIVCAACGVPTPPSAIDKVRRICLDCHRDECPPKAENCGPAPLATLRDRIRLLWVKPADRRLRGG